MRWQSFSLAVGGAILSAQICEAQTVGHGYVVCGAGGYANQFASGRVNQLAIGGEAVTPKQVGIGGEFGLGVGGGDAWFTLSLNAIHHLRQTTSRASPFFTAGYTRLIVLTEQGGRNAVNVGFGTRYSLNSRTSLLVELRDMVFQGAGATHVWTARTGLAWN